MSSILVDNLTGKTTAGSVTVTSEHGGATMQLQQGLAKSFVSATITSNTHTIQDSFNVASLTDDGAGKTDVVFTNNMNNDDYSANSTAALNGTAMFAHLAQKASITTSEYRNNTVNSSNSSTDYGVLCSVVHGDLA
jgi:hypothetical protein